MKRLDNYWYSQNPVAWLLLPVSLVFCLIVFLRKFLYQSGVFKAPAIPVPVVIIGNISVGGTGKTPLLIALCKHLQEQGYSPGIISRGYGGQASSWPQKVSVNSDAFSVGDEPVLIARNTLCPVVVGPDRVRDIDLLLNENDCDIILSDDGLQHYRLQRDIEIAVIDADRQLGNGFCLPSGPLREPVSRLKTVDMIISNGGDLPDNSFQLKFDQLVSINEDKRISLESLSGKKVHAIAGIGNPDRFFGLLENHGIELIKHRFSDHHQYAFEDIHFNDDLPILMTEKDAVKCKQFDVVSGWYLPVAAIISANALTQFNQLVKQVRNG